MEQRLEGGNAGAAVLVDGTVRRPTGPRTSSVHALLRHLEHHGFEGSPRARVVDHHGREILSFVPGATIGTKRPWPSWVHSDDALQQVGGSLRGYHDCVADFVPPVGAIWRAASHAWRPGDVIGHNDAAPYNAVWQTLPDGRTDLVGFIDWDFASPCAPIRDLAFVASAWVPLYPRDVPLLRRTSPSITGAAAPVPAVGPRRPDAPNRPNRSRRGPPPTAENRAGHDRSPTEAGLCARHRWRAC